MKKSNKGESIIMKSKCVVVHLDKYDISDSTITILPCNENNISSFIKNNSEKIWGDSDAYEYYKDLLQTKDDEAYIDGEEEGFIFTRITS